MTTQPPYSNMIHTISYSSLENYYKMMKGTSSKKGEIKVNNVKKAPDFCTLFSNIFVNRSSLKISLLSSFLFLDVFLVSLASTSVFSFSVSSISRICAASFRLTLGNFLLICNKQIKKVKKGKSNN